MATSVTGVFLFGTKDVAAAGTAVVLDATDYRIRSLLIIAHSDNAGRIFYGGSDVASTTQKGLAAGESIQIIGDKEFALSTIYIDAANANDGIDFVGAKA